jgi:4-amino-4-deoxy-L-arabinose transferase-like glycosyltransferase
MFYQPTSWARTHHPTLKAQKLWLCFLLYFTFGVIPWIFLFVIIGAEDLFVFVERFGNGSFDIVPTTAKEKTNTHHQYRKNRKKKKKRVEIGDGHVR